MINVVVPGGKRLNGGLYVQVEIGNIFFEFASDCSGRGWSSILLLWRANGAGLLSPGAKALIDWELS